MWSALAGVVLVLSACASEPASEPDPDPDPSPTWVGAPSTEVAPASSARDGRAQVVAVVDGDTLDVVVRGRPDRLRLVGVNAPEDGECLSDEATDRLEDLVGGRSVVLVRDVSDRDQYDRLLRHVLVDGTSVGEVLVAEGLAVSRAYPPDTTHQAALDAAQAEARAAGEGMWAPDACGPATDARIVVGATRTDPPGDESQTPNEEWVEIRNEGREPVDLTGWGVKDESASHRYEFPAGFRLGPGAGVRLHTGCGPDTTTDLHWCVTGSAVWNNDGDTVFVTDPNGNVVARRSV